MKKNKATILKPRGRGKILLSIFMVVILLAGGLLVALLAVSPGKTKPFLDQNGAVIQGSIAQVTRVPINGIDQGMIIRGKSDQLPVLLFLHGGPGSPEYPMAREYSQGLEENFLVCWWDQRGAGMTYSGKIPAESMNLQQMIEDTIEVTNYLRERFGQEKVYLAGHSWGSFLGVHTVAQKPDLYHAYIGIGQVANQLESEKLGYEYMVEQAKLTKNKSMEKKLAKHTLTGVESVTQDYLMLRSEYMNQLGVGLSHNFNSMLEEVVLPLLTCREYTLAQKLGYIQGILFSIQYLFKDVTGQNLTQSVPKLDIPVYIIQGKYDYQVSYVVAKEYFDRLEAPEKHFYTFENSAHCPNFEEPDLFLQVLVEDVLPNE